MNNQSTDTRVIVTGGVVEIENPQIVEPGDRESENPLVIYTVRLHDEFARDNPPFHTSPEVKDGPYLLSEFGDEVWQFSKKGANEWFPYAKNQFWTFEQLSRKYSDEYDFRLWRDFLGKGKEQVDTDRLKEIGEDCAWSEILSSDGRAQKQKLIDAESYIKILLSRDIEKQKLITTLSTPSPAHFHAGVSVGRVEGEEESKLLIDKLTADNKALREALETVQDRISDYLEQVDHSNADFQLGINRALQIVFDVKKALNTK